MSHPYRHSRMRSRHTISSSQASRLSASDNPTKPQLWKERRQLPREIVDFITDNLWDDKASLSTCNLVCKQWLHSASYHFFKEVTVSDDEELRRFRSLANRLSKEDVFGVGCGRFVRALTLQSLPVGDEPMNLVEIELELLARIIQDCSHLEKLRFVGVRWSSRLTGIYPVVTRPSVTELTLSYRGHSRHLIPDLPGIFAWFPGVHTCIMTGGYIPVLKAYKGPGRKHANPQHFPTDMQLTTMHLHSHYIPAWVWDRLAETASVKSLRSLRAAVGRPEDAWGLAKVLTATSNNLVDLRLDLTSAEYMLFFPENPDFEELGRLVPIGKLQALERLEIINAATEISALNVARFIALVDTPACRHFALKLVNNHPSATQDFFTASWSILDEFLAGHPTIEVVDISWEDDTGHEAVAEAMIREYFTRLESSGKLRLRR